MAQTSKPHSAAFWPQPNMNHRGTEGTEFDAFSPGREAAGGRTLKGAHFRGGSVSARADKS
ncbi:MAG: hypothetical protein WCA08_03150, partial [Desulfoferrobacter sp.]